MKKQFLLFALVFPFLSFSQTRTTVANGDFLNPFIWDCTCIPQSGEQAIINHAVVMNTGIYYTAGQITINPSGSLIQDGTDRAFWADGTGSFINNGTFTAHHLLISPNATLTNEGTIVGVDSVWIQGTFTNNASAEMYDFLNDQTASFTNTGSVNVLNSMNNQGFIYNSHEIEVGNDFSNCNLQSMDAMFDNAGVFCVSNDFLNCAGDMLDGSGHYYIGGSSANYGSFEGTFTFHTPSGTIGFQGGNVESSVTVTTGTCSASLSELDPSEIKVFPNPTTDNWKLSVDHEEYMLFDCTGVLIQKGQIENYTILGRNIKPGIYFLSIENSNVTIQLVKK